MPPPPGRVQEPDRPGPWQPSQGRVPLLGGSPHRVTGGAPGVAVIADGRGGPDPRRDSSPPSWASAPRDEPPFEVGITEQGASLTGTEPHNIVDVPINLQSTDLSKAAGAL